MLLYCVRHGESEGNRNKLHQDADTSLSEIGLAQARFVAHRFKTLPVDHILTSPYARARQTAEIIKQEVHKPLTLYPPLHEIDKPAIVHHKRYDHPDAVAYYTQLDQHRLEPDWHYRDEESYLDVFKRCQAVLSHLNHRPERHLIMVSHGTFLTMFLTMMLYPQELNLPLFLRLHELIHLKNTGITVFKRSRQDIWRLVTLNDFAHLG